jgi:phospholipid transport system transporter-binding protein
MNPNIELNKNGQWKVIGELSFDNVPKIYKIGYDIISENKEVIFDLQDIVAIDNSGLALLTAWTRYAKQLGKSIYFVNLPSKLLDMAKLSGLENILPIR